MVRVVGNTVEFEFFHRGVHEVHVVGDFNGWQVGRTRMVPEGGGKWHTQLHLDSGEYRFRYVADGQWFTDFGAFGLEQSPFGLDSVLVVGSQG